MPLRRLSIREIQSRPARSLLTLLSIVIGVSAIVATYLASDSAQLAQIAMVRAVTGNASLEIEAVGGASFDGKPLEPVAKLPGVRIASPILRRYSNMTVKPAKVNEALAASPDDTPQSDVTLQTQKNIQGQISGRYRVQLLGVVPELDRQVRSYTLVAGTDLEDASTDSSSVLMDASFAESAKVAIGGSVDFLTKSGVRTANVVGFVKPNDASAGIQSGLIVANLRTVQRWTGSSGKLDAVQLVLDKDAKLEQITESVRAIIPPGLRVHQPTLRSQVADASTVAMQQGLRLATAFALLISAFIIYNTFQMNVGERRRQLGILRSMGATRRQLLWMIVREGLWLGVIGTFLGCLVGNLGAAVLRNSTSKLLQIDIPPSPWSIWPYVIAVVCGLAVSLLGAFFPALRASRLSPAEAMRVVAQGEFSTSRAGWLGFGGTVMMIGLSIQALAALRIINLSHVVLGTMMMKVGIVFLLPALIGDLTAWVAWLLSPFLKTEGMLARRQILRHRGRSSLTIGIVFIAMGTGLGMASTILDNIGNVEGWYSKSIVGDFFVRAAMPDMNSGQSADMPDGLVEKVMSMPGVALVDTLRFVRARSDESSVVVVVRKFNSGTLDYFDLTEGTEAEVLKGVRNGGVVLGSVLSQRLNLHIGDTLPLETNEGSTTLRIVGVTNEYIAGGLTLYLEAEYAKKLLSVEGTDVIIVKANPNELAIVEQQLRSLCDESGMMFQSYVDLVKVIRDTLNGVVGGLWAVLALGSIIAAFGLINTLAMNILEQTREIGMLRVVAMTRWQIRRMILAQALIMGIIGIVPGVFTGLGIHYLINLTTMPVTGHSVLFTIYPWLLVGAPIFELLVVVIASMVPAERAARLNVSSALQYE
ncbi:MAG TPA: FtsX-like permease family protein [Pirellula sp.]|nr:FtsX-like permease family protein [Pirellula sp.]